MRRVQGRAKKMLTEAENGNISTEYQTRFLSGSCPKQIKTDAKRDSGMITKGRYSIPTLLEPI
jgi:hypothetical protein